jgi:hypothetical protein
MLYKFSLYFAFAASAGDYATPYVLKKEKPQDWKHRSDVDKLLANVPDGSHHQGIQYFLLILKNGAVVLSCIDIFINM